jgi:hypothetical protein
MERSGIQQTIDAFAYGQPSVIALARDIGLAAHLFRKLATAFYLVDFRLPAQICASNRKFRPASQD